MKFEKLIYLLSSILIIGGAILKITIHFTGGTSMILFGFIISSAYQQWQVQQLKKRIHELEMSK